MNTAIQKISTALQESLQGDPWYGRSIYGALEEVEPSSVFINPEEKGHALIELLYHMITWATAVKTGLEPQPDKDIKYFEKLDWRELDPTIHTWKNGVAEFKAINQRILELLATKDDSILDTPVKHRKYNFGYMLEGYIQHNIYHLGQIFYVKKLLADH